MATLLAAPDASSGFIEYMKSRERASVTNKVTDEYL
jgi:hypothetical protein